MKQMKQITDTNRWNSSSFDDLPYWSISSTSTSKNNIYIYLSNAVCKKCRAKIRRCKN